MKKTAFIPIALSLLLLASCKINPGSDSIGVPWRIIAIPRKK